MKNLLIILKEMSCILINLLFWYLIGSFIAGTFYFMEWPVFGRVAVAFLGIATGLTYISNGEKLK